MTRRLATMVAALTSLFVVLGPASSSAQVVDDEGGACLTSGAGPGSLERGAIREHEFSIAGAAFPTETWLCVTFGPVAKRLKLPVGSPASLPQAQAIFTWAFSVARVEEDGDRCATEPGNIVPGPHPIVRHRSETLSDNYAEESFDVYSNGTELWVCASFDDQLRGPIHFNHREDFRIRLGPPDGSPPL